VNQKLQAESPPETMGQAKTRTLSIESKKTDALEKRLNIGASVRAKPAGWGHASGK